MLETLSRQHQVADYLLYLNFDWSSFDTRSSYTEAVCVGPLMKKLPVDHRAYSRCCYQVSPRHQVPDFEAAIRGPLFRTAAFACERCAVPCVDRQEQSPRCRIVPTTFPPTSKQVQAASASPLPPGAEVVSYLRPCHVSVAQALHIYSGWDCWSPVWYRAPPGRFISSPAAYLCGTKAMQRLAEQGMVRRHGMSGGS